MKVKELDVILLKDGQKGTVLDFYENGNVMMIEIVDEQGRTLDTPFVKTTDIEKIIYSS